MGSTPPPSPTYATNEQCQSAAHLMKSTVTNNYPLYIHIIYGFWLPKKSGWIKITPVWNNLGVDQESVAVDHFFFGAQFQYRGLH